MAGILSIRFVFPPEFTEYIDSNLSINTSNRPRTHKAFIYINMYSMVDEWKVKVGEYVQEIGK